MGKISFLVFSSGNLLKRGNDYGFINISGSMHVSKVESVINYLITKLIYVSDRDRLVIR